MPDDNLEKLLAAVAESRKYRAVCPDLVRALGRKELASRRSLKEAVKETKNKLHQVAGAYLDERMPYTEWLEKLRAAKAEGEEPFRVACREILLRHASTRERLPIIPEFYAAVFSALPPVHSVLDLACGLNPLTLPWMNLPPDCSYHACDLYGDMTAFLNEFFTVAGVRGTAESCDLLTSPPQVEVDLALVLKVLPPLEQAEKGSGLRLLRSLKARAILLSFPTRSLGGRGKGMAAHYESAFLGSIQSERWDVRRLSFEGELCFLLT